jgi:hypothetical protein
MTVTGPKALLDPSKASLRPWLPSPPTTYRTAGGTLLGSRPHRGQDAGFRTAGTDEMRAGPNGRASRAFTRGRHRRAPPRRSRRRADRPSQAAGRATVEAPPARSRGSPPPPRRRRSPASSRRRKTSRSPSVETALVGAPGEGRMGAADGDQPPVVLPQRLVPGFARAGQDLGGRPMACRCGSPASRRPAAPPPRRNRRSGCRDVVIWSSAASRKSSRSPSRRWSAPGTSCDER